MLSSGKLQRSMKLRRLRGVSYTAMNVPSFATRPPKPVLNLTFEQVACG